MKKYKIIVLFGKSGAGKDTALKEICKDESFNKIITCTTRPKRDYEIDGVDYHFLTTSDFYLKKAKGDFIEHTCFNDWFYGTDINNLREDKINIGVFNINAITQLFIHPYVEVELVYIKASDKTRLLRNLNRECEPNCYEICRRFLADKKDFEKITTFPAMYNFDTEEHDDYSGLIQLIKNIKF